MFSRLSKLPRDSPRKYDYKLLDARINFHLNSINSRCTKFLNIIVCINLCEWDGFLFRFVFLTFISIITASPEHCFITNRIRVVNYLDADPLRCFRRINELTNPDIVSVSKRVHTYTIDAKYLRIHIRVFIHSTFLSDHPSTRPLL